jgi:hypothetical protein
MRDAPASGGRSQDQALALEPVRKGPEGLIPLERLVRQLVGRCARVAVDGTKRVPLRERRTDLAEPGIECPLVPVLRLLDGTAEVSTLTVMTKTVAGNYACVNTYV